MDSKRSGKKACAEIDLSKLLQHLWDEKLCHCQSLDEMIQQLNRKRSKEAKNDPTAFYLCVPFMYPGMDQNDCKARELKAHSLYVKCVKKRDSCTTWLQSKIEERRNLEDHGVPEVHVVVVVENGPSAVSLDNHMDEASDSLLNSERLYLEPQRQSQDSGPSDPVLDKVLNLPESELADMCASVASDLLRDPHLSCELMNFHGLNSSQSAPVNAFQVSGSTFASQKVNPTVSGLSLLQSNYLDSSAEGSCIEHDLSSECLCIHNYDIAIINRSADVQLPSVTASINAKELNSFIFLNISNPGDYLMRECEISHLPDTYCNECNLKIKQDFQSALKGFLETYLKCSLQIHNVLANVVHPPGRLLAHFASEAGEYMVILPSLTSSEKLAVAIYSTCSSPEEGENDMDEVPTCQSSNATEVVNLEMPYHEWEKVFQRTCANGLCQGCDSCEVSLHHLWSDTFAKLVQDQFPLCVLSFKRCCLNKLYSTRYQGTVMTATARCKHPKCIQLRFRLESFPTDSQPGSLSVVRTGTVTHEENLNFRRFLRKGGELRTKVEDMRKCGQMPNSIRLGLLSTANKSALKAGNFNESPSLTICQKVSSTLNTEKRLDQDPYFDLYKEWQGANKCGIVQLSTVPFRVYWRIAEHVKALLNSSSRLRTDLILYFDCTGQVVQDIYSKPVYYYCGVIRPSTSSTNVFPVLEFLLDHHYQSVITDILKNFRRDCGPSKGAKSPFFKIVVIDYSWALLHSSLDAFCDTSIIPYLNQCYDVEFNESGNIPKTAIHLCGAHEACTVKKWIAKKVSKDTAALARKSFRSLMVAKSAVEAKETFCLMIPVFCPQNISDQIEGAKDALVAHLNGHLLPNQELEDVDEPSVPDERKPPTDPSKDADTLYGKSPYYKYFWAEYSTLYDASADVSPDGEKNPTSFPAFIQYLLKYQLPYLPLWSATFVKDYVNPKSGLLTNNAIEGWFHVLKTYILLGILRLLPGDFVRKLCDEIRKRFLTFVFNTEFTKRSKPTTPIHRVKKQDRAGKPAPVRLPSGRKRKSEDSVFCQEFWDGRRRFNTAMYTPSGSVNQNMQAHPAVDSNEGEAPVSVEEVTVPAVSHVTVDVRIALQDHQYLPSLTCDQNDQQMGKVSDPAPQDDEMQPVVSASDPNGDVLNEDGAGLDEVQSDVPTSDPCESQEKRDGENSSLCIVQDAPFQPPSDFPNCLAADDLQSLTGWLTTEVINVFFARLAEKVKQSKSVSVNCCSIGVASTLYHAQRDDNASFDHLIAYCKATSAIGADLWLWPLYNGRRSHYTLIVVVMSAKTILYLDSKVDKGSDFEILTIAALLRVLSVLYKDTYHCDLDPLEWKIHWPQDVAQQKADLCGPYICAWGHSICSGTEIFLDDNAAEEFRGHIQEEVLQSAPCTQQIFEGEYPPVPPIDNMPPVLQSIPLGNATTSSYLASLTTTLWTAGRTVCKVGEASCGRKGTMAFCIGYDCRDWYHIRCKENPAIYKFKAKDQADYLCCDCRQKLRKAERSTAGKYKPRGKEC